MSKIEKLIQKLKINPTDIRFDEIRKILERYGYILSNSKGSHMRFTKKMPSLLP